MHLVFMFRSYLGRLLKAQARFFAHHSIGGFLELCSLLGEVNLCGEVYLPSAPRQWEVAGPKM